MAWRHHFLQSHDHSGKRGFEESLGKAAPSGDPLASDVIGAQPSRWAAQDCRQRWLIAAGLFVIATSMTAQARGEEPPLSANYPTIDQFNPVNQNWSYRSPKSGSPSVPAIDVHTHPAVQVQDATPLD